MYDAPIFADIQINRFSLHTTNELIDKSKIKNRVFHIMDGEVYSYYIRDNVIKSKEYIYVHFQQRKILMSENLNLDHYLILPPNKAMNIACSDMTKTYLKKLTTGNPLSWNIKGQIKRMLYLAYSRFK